MSLLVVLVEGFTEITRVGAMHSAWMRTRRIMDDGDDDDDDSDDG